MDKTPWLPPTSTSNVPSPLVTLKNCQKNAEIQPIDRIDIFYVVGSWINLEDNLVGVPSRMIEVVFNRRGRFSGIDELDL